MSKKAVKKKARKRRRQSWCQMVIRARVPLKLAKSLAIAKVYAIGDDGRGPFHDLEILSAYYDLPKQPNAMRRS